MRTTVTLDPDVEKLLRESIQRGHKTFKSALNDALRRGLKGNASYSADQQYEVKARPLGLRAGIDPSRIHELYDELEVDEFLSKSKKLQQQQA